MSREILFRGKRIDNGEWVEGAVYAFYDFKRAVTQILGDRTNGVPDAFEVDPSTVGQYTGLTDKNGKRIFEGDVVRIQSKNYEVKYLFGQFFVGINLPIAYTRCECEVIGTIHENPELLKEEPT